MRVSVVALLLLVLTVPAHAQIVITDAQYCDDCLAILPGPRLGHELTSPPVVRRDSAGRWLVSPFVRGEMPRVYSPDGTSYETFGRPGEGPNEYEVVTLIVPALGDTLLTFDRHNGRILVLGPDLREVRTLRVGMSMMTDAQVLPNGNLVVAAFINESSYAGRAIQVYAPEGGQPVLHLDPFAFKDPRDGYGARRLATGPDSFCSIVQAYRYSITCWDLNGNEINHLERRTGAWYKPQDRSNRAVTPDNAPATEMVGAWLDSDGLLWVVGMTRDRNGHTRGLTPLGQELERQAAYEQDFDRVYDAVVEVIDIQAQRVVTRSFFDPLFFGVAGPGYVYGVTEDDLGWWTVNTYQISFKE